MWKKKINISHISYVWRKTMMTFVFVSPFKQRSSEMFWFVKKTQEEPEPSRFLLIQVLVNSSKNCMLMLRS